MEGSNVGNSNDCFFGFAISLKANAVNLSRSAIWSDVKITGCGLQSATVAVTSPALSNINRPGSCNEKHVHEHENVCCKTLNATQGYFSRQSEARTKDYQPVLKHSHPNNQLRNVLRFYIDHANLNYIYQVVWLTRGHTYLWCRSTKVIE